MLGKLLEELTLQYSFEQIVDVSALSILQDIETVYHLCLVIPEVFAALLLFGFHKTKIEYGDCICDKVVLANVLY